MAVAGALHLTIIGVLISAAVSQTPPTKYTNHTVGGTSGWFFNSTTNSAATNYSSWAASQTFNLGDFLIFNTNSNQTVIQTYNPTTFKSCSTDDASDNDTSVYDGGNAQFNQASTISVPLTIQGPNYFFSDANDGNQCRNGLAFQINVNHGLGLPPSLNQPPPPLYAEPPGPDFGTPAINVPAGGSQDPGNAGYKGGPGLHVIVRVILFALLTVHVGDRGGIF